MILESLILFIAWGVLYTACLYFGYLVAHGKRTRKWNTSIKINECHPEPLTKEEEEKILESMKKVKRVFLTMKKKVLCKRG